jgi:hypothetical protein
MQNDVKDSPSAGEDALSTVASSGDDPFASFDSSEEEAPAKARRAKPSWADMASDDEGELLC